MDFQRAADPMPANVKNEDDDATNHPKKHLEEQVDRGKRTEAASEEIRHFKDADKNQANETLRRRQLTARSFNQEGPLTTRSFNQEDDARNHQKERNLGKAARPDSNDPRGSSVGPLNETEPRPCMWPRVEKEHAEPVGDHSSRQRPHQIHLAENIEPPEGAGEKIFEQDNVICNAAMDDTAPRNRRRLRPANSYINNKIYFRNLGKATQPDSNNQWGLSGGPSPLFTIKPTHQKDQSEITESAGEMSSKQDIDTSKAAADDTNSVAKFSCKKDGDDAENPQKERNLWKVARPDSNNQWGSSVGPSNEPVPRHGFLRRMKKGPTQPDGKLPKQWPDKHLEEQVDMRKRTEAASEEIRRFKDADTNEANPTLRWRRLTGRSFNQEDDARNHQKESNLGKVARPDSNDQLDSSGAPLSLFTIIPWGIFAVGLSNMLLSARQVRNWLKKKLAEPHGDLPTQWPNEKVLAYRKRRRIAIKVIFVVLEAASCALEYFGKGKWEFLLASFLVSLIGLGLVTYPYLNKRRQNATTTEAEKILMVTEIAFAVIQSCLSLSQTICAAFDKNFPYIPSIFPLVLGLIMMSYAFKENAASPGHRDNNSPGVASKDAQVIPAPTSPTPEPPADTEGHNDSVGSSTTGSGLASCTYPTGPQSSPPAPPDTEVVENDEIIDDWEKVSDPGDKISFDSQGHSNATSATSGGLDFPVEAT